MLHTLYRLSKTTPFQIGADRVIRVQTKSRFFRDTEGTKTDGNIIMATHTIIG